MLSAANIRWVAMNNFDIEHKSMVEKSKQIKTDVPNLGKNITVAKWNNPINVHAAQVFGARKATLEYVFRMNDAVVAPKLPLALGHTYYAAAGSI